MLSPLAWVFFFLASLAVLIKASGYFTDSAERIGIAFGVPPFIVGVTIVSIGTSMPELVSSILSVVEGASEIVVGNVMGSNVTNVFLILGLSAIAGKKMKTSYELTHVDLPLFVGSAFLLSMAVWDENFSMGDALLCLTLFAIYLLYAMSVERSVERPAEASFPYDLDFEGDGSIDTSTIKTNTMENNPVEADHVETNPVGLNPRIVLTLLISIVFMYIGAKYTVESVIKISEFVGVGTEVVAASAVALGTSLPEMVVSVSAAMKGKAEIAIGNVLGSNIFNALGIMGVASLFGTLLIPSIVIEFVMPMMLISTLLYFLITWEKDITLWEGWMLLVFYIFFLGRLFSWI